MNGVIVPPGVRHPLRFLLSLLALGVGVFPPCRGQSSGGDPTPTTPYMPGNDSTLGRLFPGDNYGPNNDFSRARYDPPPRYLSRIPIFFPPHPPQLGASLGALTPSQGRMTAPPELAAYVNELFYPQLSTHLAQQDLSHKLRTRLDAYRADKLALQGELRAKLETLAAADPFTRERELTAFARTQTPRIAALELTAEQLRSDLIVGGFFDDSTDWNDFRRWQLGVNGFKTPAEAILAQYQVMRAAVFYQKGLSSAQRRLLREIAMELADVASRLLETDNAATAPVASADTNPLFFFSPETSRLRLPLELPPDLARKISDYEKDKAELKRELRETVYAEDSARFDFLRARALARLAEKEQPQFTALEARAEDIRRGLALLPNFAQLPPLPALPPAITARMTGLLHDKKEAQLSALALVQDIKKIISVSHVEITKGPDGRAKLSIQISPQDRKEEKVKPVREMVARYNAENLARINALEKETADLRGEILGFVSTGPDIDDADKAVRELMDESYAAIERREEWALYQDYRAAQLEPGLSPEQRRLLFDGAVETLDLPLPGADRPIAGLQ